MSVKFIGHKQHAIVDDESDIDTANWEMGTVIFVINSIRVYVIGSGGSLIAAGNTRTFTAFTPTIGTATQVSTTRDALVSYPIDINVTSPLLAGTSGTAILEYADNSGMSTNVVQVCQGTNSTSGVLNLTNLGTIALCGMIPSAKYHRVRSVNNSGTPTFTARGGQQCLL